MFVNTLYLKGKRTRRCQGESGSTLNSVEEGYRNIQPGPVTGGKKKKVPNSPVSQVQFPKQPETLKPLKTLHTLVGMGSTAIAAALPLPW